MASTRAIEYAVQGFCDFWKRETSQLVFDGYFEVAKPFDDVTVKEAALDLVRTRDWFPLPKDFRQMLETVRDRKSPKLASQSEVVVKASPESVRKFMAELAAKGVVANAKPRNENRTGGINAGSEVGTEDAETASPGSAVRGE